MKGNLSPEFANPLRTLLGSRYNLFLELRGSLAAALGSHSEQIPKGVLGRDWPSPQQSLPAGPLRQRRQGRKASIPASRAAVCVCGAAGLADAAARLFRGAAACAVLPSLRFP